MRVGLLPFRELQLRAQHVGHCGCDGASSAEPKTLVMQASVPHRGGRRLGGAHVSKRPQDIRKLCGHRRIGHEGRAANDARRRVVELGKGNGNHGGIRGSEQRHVGGEEHGGCYDEESARGEDDGANGGGEDPQGAIRDEAATRAKRGLERARERVARNRDRREQLEVGLVSQRPQRGGLRRDDGDTSQARPKAPSRGRRANRSSGGGGIRKKAAVGQARGRRGQDVVDAEDPIAVRDVRSRRTLAFLGYGARQAAAAGRFA